MSAGSSGRGGTEGWRQQDGLSLIEVLVATALFMVIATAIAGTLTVSLRGTVHARQAALAKDVAVQKMEEIRSSPFYVPYSTDPSVGSQTDVDVLDKYFPNLGSFQNSDLKGSYFSGTYTTEQLNADANNMKWTATVRFIDASGNTVTPPSTYDSNTVNDLPPSQLIEVTVDITWPEAGGQASYPLSERVSATGQSITGGGVGGGAGNDCPHASNSVVDVFGVVVTSYTGQEEPSATIADGNLGEAHAQTSYGCSTTMQASATSGNVLVGNAAFKGASASLTGDTPGVDQDGPVTTNPPSDFPKLSFSGTYAKAEMENESHEAEAEGEATVGTQQLQLAGVDGAPTDAADSHYRKWDFLNPVVRATGANGLDDGEDLEAEIEQQNGATKGEAEVAYQQISIMPLQKWPTSTTYNPSAAQGLVFVRNLRINADANANGIANGESNPTTMNYSAQVGMFNPNKSGCTYSSTGDTCYDFYNISQSNPLQQAIPLETDAATQSKYPLQASLFTEWSSLSANDILNAMTYSQDGTNATISVDATIKMSCRYGTEATWKLANGQIDLVGEAGYQKVWMGQININVKQNQ